MWEISIPNKQLLSVNRTARGTELIEKIDISLEFIGQPIRQYSEFNMYAQQNT